jgi:hypothetical protein
VPKWQHSKAIGERFITGMLIIVHMASLRLFGLPWFHVRTFRGVAYVLFSSFFKP